MKKCSRCKINKANKHFKNNNSTCNSCIRKVTIWNLNNKEKYLYNKGTSYYKHRKDILKRLRKSRNKNKWKVSYHLAKQRCNNLKNPSYKDYGGRGIKFLMSQKDFYDLWIRDKGYNLEIPTIDRIDNDGNYEFDNCRFIEKSENTKKRNYERALSIKK